MTKPKPRERKLFRSPGHVGFWVGHDDGFQLAIWRAEPKGWQRRTAFTGDESTLEEVPIAMARGSGWPFGGRGPAPKAGEPLVTAPLRATVSQRGKWGHAADKARIPFSDWARDRLDRAADRELAEDDARPRKK